MPAGSSSGGNKLIAPAMTLRRRPSSTEVSMRRIGRAVILTLSLTLASLGAGARQAGPPVRIGVLSPQSRETSAAGWAAFRQGLSDLGWEEGRNIVIEARFADGKLDRLRNLAEERLSMNVSLILSQNSPGTVVSLRANLILRS